MEAAGRIFVPFGGAGSVLGSRFTGAELGLWEFFPTICNDSVSDTMVGKIPTTPLCLTQSHYKWWEKFPQTQICSSGSGSNPDPVPEKSINRLPTAPLLSCLLSVKEERSEVEGR